MSQSFPGWYGYAGITDDAAREWSMPMTFPIALTLAQHRPPGEVLCRSVMVPPAWGRAADAIIHPRTGPTVAAAGRHPAAVLDYLRRCAESLGLTHEGVRFLADAQPVGFSALLRRASVTLVEVPPWTRWAEPYL